MTVLFGYKFADGVLLTADTLRNDITQTGQHNGTTRSVRKVHAIQPSIGIATSGLGSLSDALVAAVKASIGHVSGLSSNKVVEFCQSYLKYMHKQFVSTNPQGTYSKMLVLIGGVDPTSSQPFLCCLADDDNFEIHDNLTMTVQGKREVSQPLMTRVQAGIHAVNDSVSLLSLVSKSIRDVSNGSQWISASTFSMLFTPNGHAECFYDDNGNVQESPF